MPDKTKIVLRRPAPKRKHTEKLAGMLRVTPDAELAVRKLCEMTGLSCRRVASELLIQAAVLCEIEQEGG